MIMHMGIISGVVRRPLKCRKVHSTLVGKAARNDARQQLDDVASPKCDPALDSRCHPHLIGVAEETLNVNPYPDKMIRSAHLPSLQSTAVLHAPV